MLGTTEAIATVPVKDIDAARRFYERTLGLQPTGEEDSDALTFKAGKSELLVYKSEYAGTNEATAVTWAVGDDLEAIVKTLKERGVTFERYDLPGTTLEGDIHIAGNLKVAWFKDPDGNIHSLANQ